MKFRKTVLFSAAGSLLCLGLQTAQAAEPPPPIGSTLEDFYSAALEFNPALEIYEERWKIQTARKQQAGARLLPQISASASKSENTRTERGTTQDYQGERYGLQLQQVLFDWQVFLSKQRANLEEDEAEANYYANLAALLTEVADKYLLVLEAEDALRSIESELEAMQNQVDQLQNLFDRQLAQVTDLYDARAKLAAIVSEQVTIESELELAKGQLNAMTNMRVGQLYELPADTALPQLQGTLDQWLDKARENNLVISAYTFALQAAEKQVSQSKGAYMPKLSLVVQEQYSNLGFDNRLIDEYDSTYIGLSVTMPLFAGGGNRASVQEARSMRNIASSELRQARLDMLEQTRTAYLQASAGLSRIRAGESLAESTNTSYTAMQRGFELGTVTSVDLLNSLRNRFQAERDLQTARYDYLRSLLALWREAGELNAEDIREISDLLAPVR